MITFSGTRYNYGWMSNFYKCRIEYDGFLFSSSEAAWQAQKTLNLKKREEFQYMSPGVSKREGRHVTLRSDWEDVKYDLMVDILKVKFAPDTKLAFYLKNSGNEEIMEDTTGWHDNIWGNCNCERCKNIVGKNLLGKALMEVRAYNNKLNDCSGEEMKLF